MGQHARIQPGGFITITTQAWIEARTGGQDHDRTQDLLSWSAPATPSSSSSGGAPPPAIRPPGAEAADRGAGVDWIATARRWCLTRRLDVKLLGPIVHTGTRLDANVWILLATASATDRIAVIGINTDPPAVYVNTCPQTESSRWWDPGSVDILCPAGHRWRWINDRDLLTTRGAFTSITRVFGTSLDAPFTPCPDCDVSRSFARPRGCGCNAAPWIVCPTCAKRCDVELPTRAITDPPKEHGDPHDGAEPR